MRGVMAEALWRETRPLLRRWAKASARQNKRWASIGTVFPIQRTASLASSPFVFGRPGNYNRRYSNPYRHGNGSTTLECVRCHTTGLFGNPAFSSAEGFGLATEEALSTARDLVREIAAMAHVTPSPEVAVKMDELSDVLCRVADLSECARLLHPDPAIRTAAQRSSLAINAYVEQLNADPSLHASLLHFARSDEFSRADEVTKRTTQLLMHDFETCGIHLALEERSKVIELNNSALELSHQFVENASLPSLVAVNECPLSLRKHFPLTRDGSHVAVDHVPFHSPDSILRSVSYQLYHAELPSQVNILENLLQARQKSSQLASYRSFAHKTLKTCMAKDPETVQEFLERLSEKILPLALEEAEEMKRFNTSDYYKDSSTSLQLCDVNWCISEAQKQIFASRISELSDFFSLKTVLGGLAQLCQSLFGITMETVSTHQGEVWSDDVIKLAFRDGSGDILGYCYCDLFAREGKFASDCHFTIQGGRERSDGTYQTPIIALCCNFGRGRNHGDDPLLSLGAMENLFHEMGHALHSILGRSRYQNVTGTRCSTDFAEVPSTLMESFLADSRVLQLFARHCETGHPISGLHSLAVQLSGRPFPAFDMQIQIVYALTDLFLHTSKPANVSSVKLARDVFDRYGPVELLPGTTWVLRFNHLYGYGARYYSYLWARGVSSLIWRHCFEKRPFSRESGNRLRTMLSFGGGLHPNLLLRDLLNFEPSVSDLVDTLHSSVMEHRLKLREISSHL